MATVTISTPRGSYRAVIESGLMERAGEQLRAFWPGSKKLFIVTVAPVRRRWGQKLKTSLLAAGFETSWVEMPDGERHKRLGTLEDLAEKLVRAGAQRDAALLAFGGGVVGDVTGMLASIYMRGIDVVQIPTTILAQVDASIGGKTGVNLRAGKNLLGTFHQPRAVLVDPAVLSTLPEREFRSGLLEALKCGIIGRPELFLRLETTTVKTLKRDLEALQWVIAESIRLKAEVVSADERENGLRRVLNLGHTIGHALEAETGYRHFLHGEAVGWGMVAAARIAVDVDRLDKETFKRITGAVLALGPLPRVEVRTRNVLRRLQADKKTRNGVVHFVLPERIGKVEVVDDVPEKVVIGAVEALRNLSLNVRAGDGA